MDQDLRDHLARSLGWGEAHMTFDDAVADLAPPLRGRTPAGLPYSPWQLLEHIRITQHDILDFCRNPNYEEITWPDDYWPKSAGPAVGGRLGRECAEGRRGSRRRFRRWRATPPSTSRPPIPHGTGQTYLREILLVDRPHGLPSG